MPWRCLLGLMLATGAMSANCGKDTYFWGLWDGKVMCQDCPAEKHSAACTDCVKDPLGATCIESCDQGMFHSTTGCSECEPGKFQGGVGMHGCHDCPAGMSQSESGKHQCVSCDIGRYSDTAGAIHCQRCDKCDAGRFGTTDSVGIDTFADCKCKICPAGTESQAGFSECNKCSAGKFTEDPGEATCTLCPTGKFAPTSGSAICQTCNHGWTTAAAGADEELDCNVEHVPTCPAGRKLVVVGMEHGVEKHDCVNCEAGKFGIFDEHYEHGGRCEQCTGLGYQPATGRTECLQCDGGSVNSDQTECTMPTQAPTTHPTVAPTLSPTPPPTPPTQSPTSSPTVVPGDCQVSEWGGVWSTCSEPCGSGVQYQHRTVLVAAVGTGQACPALRKEQNCNVHPCPEHCTFKWTDWSECSRSCEGGFQTRIAIVESEANHGGDDCPELEEQVCNLQTCPTDAPTKAPTVHVPTHAPTNQPTQSPTTAEPTAAPTLSPTSEPTPIPDPLDCLLTEWIEGACSASCGAESQSVWSRDVVHQAKFGGIECGQFEMTKVVDCAKGPCPVDCAVTAWGNFTECTSSCGSGTRDRSRTVEHPAEHGGEPCPYLHHEESCNVQHCPRDCEVGEWSSYSTCSKTCAGGLKMRYRAILRSPKNGGQACPTLSTTESCNDQHCGLHCEVSAWQPWSACTVSCGGGERTRRRSVTQDPTRGGHQCPKLEENTTCSPIACPVDCEWAQWSDWTPCSVTCGGGHRTRVREVATAPGDGGVLCPGNNYAAETCNAEHCAMDCELSSWGSWQACPATCTPMGSPEPTQLRHRSIEQGADYGGHACGVTEETRKCGELTCPMNCIMEQWGHWSTCTHTCGKTGIKRRSRQISSLPKYGGVACPTVNEEAVECGRTPCPWRCEISAWGQWSSCSKSCDTGSKSRSRTILSRDENGSACPTLVDTLECETDACPVDCKMSEWADFTMCTKTCGGGYQHRAREILVHPASHGVACGPQMETVQCGTVACPNDCVVSAWTGYSACTKSCEGGTQHRFRSVLLSYSQGGKPCPELHQVLECQTHPCPVDCTVGRWTEWTDCSQTCGGGTRGRSRTHIASRDGGKACPYDFEEESCNLDKPCAADCVVGEWAAWGACSASCGAGLEVRTRHVDRASVYGGDVCPALQQTRICSAFMCPQDCETSSWSEWSECSLSCGGTGLRSRFRHVETQGEAGGAACGSLTTREACSLGPCPVHCEVSAWQDWGACTGTCGSDAMRTRERTISTHEAHGGYTCPELTHTDQCPDMSPCPVDCAVAQWSEWGSCTSSCGEGGSQTRTREVATATAHGGVGCPQLEQEQECNRQACPIDCEMASWGIWSPCTYTCGGGERFRFRSMKYAAAFGGQECPTPQQTDGCGDVICPVDCVVSEYEPWQPCDRSCGAGIRLRYRSIVTPTQGDGEHCPTLKDEGECVGIPCPVDCQVSDWSEFSECSHTCGAGGIRVRGRDITLPVAHGGQECPELQDSEICDLGPCPVHCVVSDWEHSSACSKTCGGGFQTRTRVVLSEAKHGGTCPHLEDEVPCSTAHCPVDCEMHVWSEWTECTAECGTGFQVKSREVKVHPQHGGKVCGEDRGIQFCNTHLCPVDCHISEWGGFTGCSTSCGEGSKSRTRSIIAHPENGGELCPSLNDLVTCVLVEHCPVDCAIDYDQEWSTCSKSCGGGFQTKDQPIVQEAAHGGLECPPPFLLHDERMCNSQTCPYDCEQTEWSEWTECDVVCGGGQQVRFRHTLLEPSGGGAECGAPIMAKDCNTDPCPVNCELSEWSEWSVCSATCDSGAMLRSREISTPPAHGGSECQELTQERICRAATICPVHCEVSIWTAWTECTESCGEYGGEQHRERVVTQSHNDNGNECPPLTQSQSCNEVPCPVDCELFEWSDWDDCDATCDGGHSRRFRTIMTNTAHGGLACNSTLLEEKECNPQECPIERVDCVLSGWGPWTGCTCSAVELGTKTHERAIVVHPSKTGVKCETAYENHVNALPGFSSTVETIPCTAQDCTLAPTPSPTAPPTRFPTHSPSKSPTTTHPTLAPTLLPTPAPTTVAPTSTPTLSPTHRPTRNLEHDCLLSRWSEYSACTKSCAGGKRTRTRDVLREAVSDGAPCSPVRSETKPCNTHVCPWETVVQAENVIKRQDCIVGGSVPGFTGHGYIRSMSLASGDPCVFTVAINVPWSGRYKLKYRYETENGQAHDMLVESVDHAYTVNVDFPKSDGVWGYTDAYVDFFKGRNEVSLTTSQRSLNIDAIHVIHENLMQRCKKGDTVTLDWLGSAFLEHDIDRADGDSSTLLASSTHAHMSGRIELGTRGPWQIQFDTVEPQQSGSEFSNAAVSVSLNDFQENFAATQLAGQKSYPFRALVDTASLHYKFNFHSSSALEADNLQVKGGKAVCQGCQHIKCSMEEHPTISRSYGSIRRMVVHHGFDKTGSFERHHCSYDKKTGDCSCSCGTQEEDYTTETEMP